MLYGKELSRYVINARIAEKRRAPYLTAAKNLIKNTQRKLIKKHGGDTMTTGFHDATGNEIGHTKALELLQKFEPVTLKQHVFVKEGDGTFFSPDVYRVAGEMTIQLKRG